MATCDLCAKKCSASDMTQLRDIYRIEGVEDICGDCRTWADKELDRLRAAVAPQMREVIAKRIGAPPATEKKSIWRRMFSRGGALK